jgi:tetratricopeptide (TPR) repeat protein
MRNALRSALACGLLLAVAPAPSPPWAQSDSELNALYAQAIELRRAGKFTEAIPLAQRYADAMKARHGAEHPEYATALNNQAQLLQDNNRLGEAEPLYRLSLAIDEKNLGPEHPNVARDLNNLAELCLVQGRYSEAEPLMRRALAIDEKSFGLEHPEVAVVLNNLAALLQDTNRLSEAEPLMRRALAIDRPDLIGWYKGTAPAPLDRAGTELIDRKELFPSAEPRQDGRDLLEFGPIIGVWARKYPSGLLKLVSEFFEVLGYHAS